MIQKTWKLAWTCLNFTSFNWIWTLKQSTYGWTWVQLSSLFVMGKVGCMEIKICLRKQENSQSSVSLGLKIEVKKTWLLNWGLRIHFFNLLMLLKNSLVRKSPGVGVILISYVIWVWKSHYCYFLIWYNKIN